MNSYPHCGRKDKNMKKVIGIVLGLVVLGLIVLVVINGMFF